MHDACYVRGREVRDMKSSPFFRARRLPFFPIFPLVPIAFMVAQAIMGITLFRRLRALEDRMA